MKNELGSLGLIALVVLSLLWSISGVAQYLPRLASGLPHALDYALAMFPPDWSILPELVGPFAEQLRMAILAIHLATSITMVLAFLAARNTTPALPVYIVVRGFINVCRGLPTMIWALLFVAMVGLGPLAGIMALTVHCIGTLGKYFSESIETIGPQIKEILEAMRVDGANEWQVLYYGLLREVAPLFASYTLYYFEWALRVGTTLGLVGAGGLGLRLMTSIRLFRRQQTLTMILAILAVVIVVDTISGIIRKRLVES